MGHVTSDSCDLGLWGGLCIDGVLGSWIPGSLFLSLEKGRWLPGWNGFSGQFHRLWLSPLSLPLLSCPSWAAPGQADRLNV